MPGPTHQPPVKVIVSVATFNELAAQLERQGYKFGENVTSYVVEKGTNVVPDKDFRLVNMRQNAVDLAAKTYDNTVNGDFVDYANKVFEFIYNGMDGLPNG